MVFLGYVVPWINLTLLFFRLLCVFFSLLPFNLENAEMAAQKDRFSRNFVCILILSSASYPVQSLFEHRIRFGWRFLFLKIKRKEYNSLREYLNICHMWRSKVIHKLRPNKVEYFFSHSRKWNILFFLFYNKKIRKSVRGFKLALGVLFIYFIFP